jgi:aryl-alcohol dehydrogenase-like predicted oxidoreductase
MFGSIEHGGSHLKRRTLGSLGVSAIGLGCMSMTDSYGKADPEESERTLLRAVELGVTFFDTANAYGLGRNEQLVGRVLAPHRKQVQISTKFGFVIGDGGVKIDGAPAQVATRCDESLERLGVEAIDLYFLHRPDPDVPIEETVGAMARLVEAGKVLHLGLCEVSARSLRKAHAVHPIAAVQSEYSLWTRDPEGHVLPACRELGVGFVPFSPIGRAVLTGTIDKDAAFEQGQDMRSTMPRFQGENLDKNLALVEELRSTAKTLGIAPGQLALAWLLAKADDIVPIPGTKRRAYLEENSAAAEIALEAEHVQRLDHLFAPERISGERYGASWMRSSDSDD